MVGEAVFAFDLVMPIDPLKPMATRALIHAVQSGETLIIFPEGRLTVTGSLMKVYDGAGLIADKSDATIVPIRIDGLERSPFTRLRKDQVRRKLFPKLTVTVLEPVKLNLDPVLRGKVRRRAAGAALYDIMSEMIYKTTSTDGTIPEALIAAGKEYGLKCVATEDVVTGALSYKRLMLGVRILGKKLMPPCGGRQAGRRDAAECERRSRDDLRPDVVWPGARHDQFHCWRCKYPCRLQGGTDHDHRNRPGLRR